MRKNFADSPQSLLRSDFEMRGEALRGGFAKRYGGGFVGSSEIAETFSDDAGDMVKKVVTTDTKTINDMIASSLSEKIKEEAEQEKEAVSYGREDVVADAQMSPDQVEQLFSDMMADQETAKKAVSSTLTEDSPVKNIAAALQTTEDATITGIDGFGIDPQVIQALIDSQQITTPESVTDSSPVTTSVSDQFSDLVDQVFSDKPDVPEDYKLSKVNVTYTKVEPEPEEDEEEIDSIDVTGKLVDDLAKAAEDKQDELEEEIESIDVRGRLRDEEEIEDIDVEGRLRDEDEIEDIDVEGRLREEEEEPTPRMRRDDYEEEDTLMNPWEKFKRLYADFYTGGRGKEVLRSFNRREAAGEFDTEDPTEAIQMAVKEYEDLSSMGKDTNEILRAKDEKDQMTMYTDMMRNDEVDKSKAPIIVNSNRTIMAKADDASKTERVFSDDNTFNRLSIYDSNHPQYTGYR